MVNRIFKAQVGLTMDLTHAGPKTVDREAELRRPSGVVCSDLVMRSHCESLSDTHCFMCLSASLSSFRSKAN